ncbi:MAG: ATP-binding protein [Methylobacterium sp.]|nr:ATP-binding protein [Methylobacterium sp.]
MRRAAPRPKPLETGSPAWQAANAGVIACGLEWIIARLAGGEDAGARAAYEAARAAMAEAGAPSALDHISATLALAPFDEDVLLAALAPEIDAGIAQAYGVLQGLMTPQPASPLVLARLLLGAARLGSEAMARLAPQAPLRRLALIDEEPAPLAVLAPLRLSASLRARLLGQALAPPTGILPAVPLSWTLAGIAARFEPPPGQPLRCQIVGPPRSGRKALAAALLARHGWRGLRMAPPAPDALAATLREAALEGLAPVIDLAGDQTGAWLEALAAAVSGPLLVVARQPPPELMDWPLLRLEPLEPPERAMLWRRAVPTLEEAEIGALAEHFALGPGEIERLARRPGLTGEGVWRACRDLAAPGMGLMATRIVPRRTLEEMVLEETCRADLDALAAQMRQRARVLGDWGYRGILGASTGITALFAGPSGVGKTMAAEGLAGRLGLDLHVIDLSRLTSKYIGETEKNLAQVFEAAEAGGAVLFFDEADAIFGKRSEVKDSHDRYANGEISYLLQRMERFSGLAILATNLKANLDTAFLRRLRMVIDFPLPDALARARLWQRALPSAAPLGAIDHEKLARIELSGGNITTVATNAAFRAAEAGEPIGMAHLRAALVAELRKLERDTTTLGGL